MGPEPGRIISKVDFKRRHLSKYLPRNSNSSQSKTARPKDTLVSTRHAAEFMGQPTFSVKQMWPNYNSDGDAYKENHDPDNNIQKEDDAVTPHPHEREKSEYQDAWYCPWLLLVLENFFKIKFIWV